MKKWTIAASGIALVILVSVAFVFTFTRESETSEPENGNINLPLTEEEADTPGEGEPSSQPTKSIEQVKAAWEERLMARPGVIGVGIGLTKDGQEPAIKVYINHQAAAQAAQIPQEIEGYPVEVEIRGAFRFQ